MLRQLARREGVLRTVVVEHRRPPAEVPGGRVDQPQQGGRGRQRTHETGRRLPCRAHEREPSRSGRGSQPPSRRARSGRRSGRRSVGRRVGATDLAGRIAQGCAPARISHDAADRPPPPLHTLASWSTPRGLIWAGGHHRPPARPLDGPSASPEASSPSSAYPCCKSCRDPIARGGPRGAARQVLVGSAWGADRGRTAPADIRAFCGDSALRRSPAPARAGSPPPRPPGGRGIRARGARPRPCRG